MPIYALKKYRPKYAPFRKNSQFLTEFQEMPWAELYLNPPVNV